MDENLQNIIVAGPVFTLGVGYWVGFALGYQAKDTTKDWPWTVGFFVALVTLIAGVVIGVSVIAGFIDSVQ